MAGTPSFDTIIDKYYPAGTRLRDIYMQHALQVTDEALATARRKQLPLDENEIRAEPCSTT